MRASISLLGQRFARRSSVWANQAWIDGIHFCCLQRRCDRHPCPAAAVAAGEEDVLPDDGLGSDRPLNNVGVNLDAPIGKKSLEDVSMLGKVLRG